MNWIKIEEGCKLPKMNTHVLLFINGFVHVGYRDGSEIYGWSWISPSFGYDKGRVLYPKYWCEIQNPEETH